MLTYHVFCSRGIKIAIVKFKLPVKSPRTHLQRTMTPSFRWYNKGSTSLQLLGVSDVAIMSNTRNRKDNQQ